MENKVSIWEYIITSGLTEDLPVMLKKRVVPTNIIALIIAVVIGIPFTIISAIYFPSLAVYPLVGGVICASCVPINRHGGLKITRYLVAFVPIILGAIYNSSLSGATDDPLPALYLIELSFALIPFVIFDSTERISIIIVSIISSIIILSFPITKYWFHAPYDSSVIRTGWLSSVTILIAILSEFGSVMGLVFINRQSERESDQSRLEAEERSQKLLMQQEENIRKTNELELAQAEEKKRQWAAEGITQVSEIVRQTTSDEAIFDQLAATTVKYLKANQGGIFVVDRSDEEQVMIELRACYAYERKKFIENTIIPGEGLVGQAFLEKDYLYFTDIPEDYVRITSGLGQATPTSLLIVPMKVNDVVEGVLELASFHSFEEHEIDFLKKLGEVIASFIQNQRVMLQTRQLLESAQEQSEEMRAQEEEMRQNMEELQATQEEMHRKEKEYQNQIQQLEEQLTHSAESV
ncbi:MAG: GAF domain-containing protein [Cyclobacteriaceae bacterium]